MKIISNDQTVRSDTIQDLRELNNQSLATQATNGEQLFPMMPAIKKAFDLTEDDTVDLSTEKGPLKSEIGFYDKKWLEECKAKLLKQIGDERRANSIMSRMQKQMKNIK